MGSSADLVALERLAIPTVVVADAYFVESVQDQANFSGLVEPLLLAIVPGSLANITPAKIVQYGDAVLDDIVGGLVVANTVQEKDQLGHKKKEKSNIVTYLGANAWDVLDMMNKSSLK